MPLPMPSEKHDTEKDWMQSCMAHPKMMGEYADAKKRAAVCHQQWAKHMKKPMKQTDKIACDLVSVVDPGDAATVEIMLMPWGKVVTTDGRNFVVDEESVAEIAKAYAAGKKEIPIDFEHTTEGGRYATPSGAAPASGWITKIYAKVGEGIFAAVKWNATAREMIRRDEYRYLSPVVMVRRADHKAVAVTSAALTNTPAIVDMERVAAKEIDTGVETMNFTELKAALIAAGVALKDDAEGDDILSAAKVFVEEAAKAKAESPPLSAVATKLGLAKDATTEVVVAKLDALAVETVPVSEYKAVVSRVEALELSARDRAGQEVVAYGIETAKINPNNAPLLDVYRVQAKADPIAFRKQLDLMPELYKSDRMVKPSTVLDGEGVGRAAMIAKAKAEYDENPAQAMGAKKVSWINAALKAGNHSVLDDKELKAVTG